jgi:hypothetical protein
MTRVCEPRRSRVIAPSHCFANPQPAHRGDARRGSPHDDGDEHAQGDCAASDVDAEDPQRGGRIWVSTNECDGVRVQSTPIQSTGPQAANLNPPQPTVWAMDLLYLRNFERPASDGLYGPDSTQTTDFRSPRLQAPTTAPFTAPIPWRRPGVRHSNNEIYFDIEETLDAIMDR